VFPAPKALETPKLGFESTPTACFQNPIFIMRIAEPKQSFGFLVAQFV
jgi:hypothetical protein